MFKLFIALQYKMGKLTAEQVQAFVAYGRITQDDADDILGKGGV